MHHRQSTAHHPAAQPHAWQLFAIGLLAMGFRSAAAVAEDRPSAAMMEPVHGLVAFMSTLRPGEEPAMFARRGLCIVENFAPFLFCGPHAASDWAAGFRGHAAEGGLEELAATFGDAQDFSQSGNRAYFSLPTTWTGLTNGKPFEEHGAWSFVLQRQSNGWRIVAYGWGVTAYTESPSVKSGS
jgi:hypothetical protein